MMCPIQDDELINIISDYNLYIHNGSYFYSLSDNMPWVYMGKDYLKIKKLVIKSLPTKSYSCGEMAFESCLKATLAKRLEMEHNCYIPFLNLDGNKTICSNEIILNAIHNLEHHIKTKETFENCQDLKPCHEVVYYTVEYANSESKHFVFKDGLMIYFPNQLVEVITNSYSYTGLSLFAELGGVIGMLLGFSVFGLLDTLINNLQKFLIFIRGRRIDDQTQTNGNDLLETHSNKNGFDHQLILEELKKINEEMQLLKIDVKSKFDKI